MSGHTPGPWTIASSLDLDGWLVGTPDIDVAHIGSEGVSQAAFSANARLIAAAPDLLDALLWVVNVACGVGRDGNAPAADEMAASIDAAQAAIAKAEGRS